VRFILETKEPLTVEHYKRVIFEGIPPKTKDKNVKVGINLRQDLPVLIHPKKSSCCHGCMEITDLVRTRERGSGP
jgi:P pilus assembly chaperone PapD